MEQFGAGLLAPFGTGIVEQFSAGLLAPFGTDLVEQFVEVCWHHLLQA